MKVTHQSRMKKSQLNNLILEAYAEVLTELNEAPEGLYYIKVSVRDARKAINIIDDQPELRRAVEFSGSDTYYLSDEQLAYDLKMDLGAHGIEIIDTNIDDELEEGTGKVKKGTWAGKPVIVYMDGPDHEWKVKFTKTGKILDYVELMANLKFDDGTDYRDYLNESLLDELDEQEPEPEEEPDMKAGPETVLEDATDTILTKFPTLKAAIVKLQTEDFKEFVDTIDWISPRPTAFRVNLVNGQDYTLKWTGKAFEASILGKRYLLSNIAEYQQALDKLAVLYREAPMKGAGEEEGSGADTDFGSADTGGGGEFPGGEEGGGDDLGADLGGEEGGEEGGADLSDEPVDFESGEEG